MNIYRDLENLQEAYCNTFTENAEEVMTYRNYLKRCKDCNIPKKAIMSEDEYNAQVNGDWEEDKIGKQELTGQKSQEDEESYLAPKSKLTEEEAMDWFSNSDTFHQLFHKFMQQQKYTEQEVNGKQFWVKTKHK